MADKKVWKLSKFEGGLNNYTDPKDLKVNEFTTFQDIYPGKIGVAIPLGHAVKSLDIPTEEISGRLIKGKGLVRYNSDYTFQSSSAGDLVANFDLISENQLVGIPSQAFFYYSSVLWLFNKCMPCGGTLTFTPTVGGNAIGSAISVLEGTRWFTDYDNPPFTDAVIINPGDNYLDGTDSTTANIYNQNPYNSDTSVDLGLLNFGYVEETSQLQQPFASTTTVPWKLGDNTPTGWLNDDDILDNLLDEDGWAAQGMEISPFNGELIKFYNTHPEINPFGYWHWNEERYVFGGVTGATSDDNVVIHQVLMIFQIFLLLLFICHVLC